VVAVDAAVVYRRSAAPRFVTLALRALLSTVPIIATRLPLLDNCTPNTIFNNYLNIFKYIIKYILLNVLFSVGSIAPNRPVNALRW
jgi:hypothetical protein